MRASTARVCSRIITQANTGLEIAAVSSGFRLFDLGFVGVHTKRIGAKLATSQRVTNHYFLSERSEADEGLF